MGERSAIDAFGSNFRVGSSRLRYTFGCNRKTGGEGGIRTLFAVAG